MTDNYEPFGPEWEKGLMKITKPFLIGMIRNCNLKRKTLEAENEALRFNNIGLRKELQFCKNKLFTKEGGKV